MKDIKITLKQRIVWILEELKWGKMPDQTSLPISKRIYTTCGNAFRGINPCCGGCPACDCHREIERYADQIIKVVKGWGVIPKSAILHKGKETLNAKEVVKRMDNEQEILDEIKIIKFPSSVASIEDRIRWIMEISHKIKSWQEKLK